MSETKQEAYVPKWLMEQEIESRTETAEYWRSRAAKAESKAVCWNLAFGLAVVVILILSFFFAASSSALTIVRQERDACQAKPR